PNDVRTRLERAALEIPWRADIRPLHAAIEKVLADDPRQAENDKLNEFFFNLACLERDPIATSRAVAALPEKNSFNDDFGYGRAFWTGLVARMKGDTAAAHAAFVLARAEQEQLARAQPDFGIFLSGLGLI